MPDNATWPPELDALIAAPDQHGLLFENDSVRVIDTRIAPGEIVPMHSHCWPATYYVISWSDIVRFGPNGEVQNDTRGKSTPTPGQAIWATALPPHTVENVGGKLLHIISVEIKKPL
jgi:quercetin dioxygenase-like cupin family protein